MKPGEFQVVENYALTDVVYEMILEGDTSEIKSPGQFVEIQLPGLFLRRPISVCWWGARRLALVYKVVGRGTGDMAEAPAGTVLNLLTGLGNGYDLAPSGGPACFWVAGGSAAAVRPVPGAGGPGQPSVVLGFNTGSEVFYEDRFRELGAAVTVTTADGAMAAPDFVIDAMDRPYSYFYACGPLPMLRAIEQAAQTPGQYSMEERMGCGFGACMGCTIQTQNGPPGVQGRPGICRGR